MTFHQKPYLTCFVFLCFVALVGTLVFWFSPLDMQAASVFYLKNEQWQDKHWLWTKIFYKTGTWLPYGVLIASVLVLFLPRTWLPTTWRRALHVWLLAMLIGPGLLINGLSKPLTERARPRQVEVFGGQCTYAQPFVWGTCDEGRAFPCGHCSTAFSVAAIGASYLRTRLSIAVLWWGISLCFGAVMGAARMAAGGHFASDVWWSAMMTWACCLVAAWCIEWWSKRPKTPRGEARYSNTSMRS